MSLARTSTWRGRSSIASRIARWPPAAASRPWTRTITRSAIRSTSLSTCELTITVRPSAPSCLNSVMRWTRWTGSAPFSGSSSTSTCGSQTSAAATLVRWRMPLLNVPTLPVGGVEHADRGERPLGRRRGRRCRADRRRSATSWRAVSPAGTASSSGTRPTVACTRRSRRGSRPSTRTVPWLTAASPAIARISVVLPAPFGPSRPVTPGPNEQLSSDRATFCPNHTETSVDLDGRRRRRTPDRRTRGRRVRSSALISAPPSGSGTAARRRRRRRRACTARGGERAVLHARQRGALDRCWPRKHDVAQVQRHRQHVDQRAAATRRRCRSVAR